MVPGQAITGRLGVIKYPMVEVWMITRKFIYEKHLGFDFSFFGMPILIPEAKLKTLLSISAEKIWLLGFDVSFSKLALD